MMSQEALCMFIIFSTSVVLVSSSTHQTCRPTDEALQLKRVFERVRVARDFDPISPNPLDIFEEADETCPHMNSHSHRGLAIQSLCPWEYVQNHSENRYPNKLWYARCTCSRCMGSNYRCRPVYHNVAVIREQCINGTYDFYWDTETIPVGCTCVHSPIRLSTKRTSWSIFSKFGIV